jgi:PhnB protein
MKIEAYLNFNGTCAEAFRAYEQVLGGKITMMMTHGDSPMADQVPADWKDAVMHVRLEVGDQALMGSDAPPPYFQQPQGFSVSLQIREQAETERIYNALAEGGTVKMPLQKTFWAGRFGMLVDRFGTPWIINGEEGD